MTHDKPPHSSEAEQGILSSILQSPSKAIQQCVEKIRDVEYFYVPAHRTIYQALLDRWDAGGAIDLITFTQFLRDRGELDSVGGAAFVTALQTFTSVPENVGYYIDTVHEKHVLRQMIAAGTETVRRAYAVQADPAATLAFATQKFDAVKLHRKNGSGRPHDDGPLIEFLSPTQIKKYEPPTDTRLVGDYHVTKGDVFLIAGPPGVGKSLSTVYLAVAGRHEIEWFGLPVHRQFKTMIIQAENGKVRLRNELQNLDCEDLDEFVRITPPPLYGLSFKRSDFKEQTAEAIADFKPDVVIIDPWISATHRDKTEDYLDTLDEVRSVLPKDETPALGIVAHTRKPQPNERASGRALLHMIAGSYTIGARARTAFVMQAASDDTTDNRIVWTCCKNNNGEHGPRSAWERRNGLFRPVQDFD